MAVLQNIRTTVRTYESAADDVETMMQASNNLDLLKNAANQFGSSSSRLEASFTSSSASSPENYYAS